MRIPINSDLYINDCILDPLDWINPIIFTNPNIHVVRSYGIHPRTNAPKPFFTRLADHLSTISNLNLTAGFGPLSFIPDNTPSTPDFGKFLSVYKNIVPNPPFLISSSPNDLEYVDKLLFPNTTIIWQNLNNNEPEYFSTFCRKILPRSDNYFITVNGKCLEYKYANQISSLLKSKHILDKILLGTDSPHYTANYYSFSYSQPLHIANIILEFHQHMIKCPDFSHFTLADTNDYFTSKSLSHFPRNTFNKMNTHSSLTTVRKTTLATLEEYKHLIRFIGRNTTENYSTTPISNSSKRPITSDIGLSPIKIPSEPNTLSKPIIIQQEQPEPTLPDFSKPIIPQPSSKHIVDQTKPNSHYTADKFPQDSKPKRFRFDSLHNLPANNPKLLSKVSPTKITIPENDSTKENVPLSRHDLIVKCAYDLSYPGHQNPSHSSRSSSPSGSSIQILPIPQKLINRLKEKSKFISNTELPSILSTLVSSRSPKSSKSQAPSYDI